MKKILIFFAAILFNGVLFAQIAYDPLTDPAVQKPANPTLFLENMRVMRQLEILQGKEYSRAEYLSFLDDFTKTKAWRSTIQKVVVRNMMGNDFEKDNKYEDAIKVYYWVVWNKNDYSGYHLDDPIVGFYYFKTCYDLGRLLFKMGDYKNSYEFYTTAVDFYKTDSSLYFATVAGINGIENSSVDFSREGNGLLKMISQAVALKPNSAAYISTRGKLYLNHLKDTVNAFADFNKAVQLNPKDDESYMYLSLINYLRSNNSAAINNITQSIAINKSEGRYYIVRATIHNETKNYASALADYNDAIRLDNANVDYYLARADCYNSIKNYAAAYDDYGFATMLNPNDADSKKELQRLDPFLKAEYEKIGFTPQNAFQFFMNRADSFEIKNHLSQAVMSYQKCIMMQPKNPVLYNKAGVIFNRLRMNNIAKQYLRYAAYADGKNPVYFVDLGNAYYDEKDFKAASGCYDTAALLGSKDDFYYNLNGTIKHFELKNYEGAIKDFTKAYELQPKYNDIYLRNRGTLYYGLKNYKAALADFEALHKLDPNDNSYKEIIQALIRELKE
ncbi:MAG: tetratricopeptide repeat protein [Ferruginibacter sp.]